MVKGFLHIITTPVSGDIFINNEYRGTLDLNIEVDPGIYTISFGFISGYMTPESITVTVDSGYITVVTGRYAHG